jgi:hypothetical protein
MHLLSAGALLPHSIGPYVGLMIGGFVVAAYGHGAKLRWVVAIGIIMIFLATLLLPIALQVFSEEPPPPGPKVPIALIAG